MITEKARNVLLLNADGRNVDLHFKLRLGICESLTMSKSGGKKAKYYVALFYHLAIHKHEGVKFAMTKKKR